jgi:phosphoribosylanthranilate isomerase
MNAGQRTRVKICGLTREQDVRAACALGADAVGFVCFPGSARFVPPDRLAALAAAATPLVTPVLLFVNARADAVAQALAAVPHALLQFHGTEEPQECASYGRPFLRAVPMAEGVDLLEYEGRFCGAAALLADTPAHASAGERAAAPQGAGPEKTGAVPAAGNTVPTAAGAYGGAGRTFPWERLAPLERRRLPLILAGGLRADNVAAAIGQVRPYAVDVSSGVEQARGIKSIEQMHSFLAAVRMADAGLMLDRGGAA